MKKGLIVAVCGCMVLSMAGCSAFGGGFKSESKKIQDAVEEACDAEEASNKERKTVVKGISDLGSFGDGLYMTLDEDEILDMRYGLEAIDEESIKKAFAFIKSDPATESSIVAMVLEVSDAEMGEDIIDEISEMYEEIDEDLMTQYKEAGFEAGFGTEDDDGYYAAMLCVNGETMDVASGAYIKCNKKIITIVIYSGVAHTDLLSEFYDLMDEAKLTDMEDLMDD